MPSHISHLSATYSYDANGNRTNAGYATGTGNRTINDGVWTYTYNAEGNVIKKSKGAFDETWEYDYDHRNQLTGSAFSATDGGSVTTQVTYVYDALGNRIERAAWDGASTTVERYAYDGWDTAKPRPIGNEQFDVFIDLDGTSDLTMRRLHGPGFDEVIARIDDSGVADWYLSDKQGSVRVILDNSASVTNTITYDAFGEITSGVLDDRYGYTGREWDETLGLWFYRDRVRDSVTFYSEDPLGLTPDTNAYRYVGNGPTNGTDPSGRTVFIPDTDKKWWSDAGEGNIGFLLLDSGNLQIALGPGGRNYGLHHRIKQKLTDLKMPAQEIDETMNALYEGHPINQVANFPRELDRYVELRPSNRNVPQAVKPIFFNTVQDPNDRYVPNGQVNGWMRYRTPEQIEAMRLKYAHGTEVTKSPVSPPRPLGQAPSRTTPIGGELTEEQEEWKKTSKEALEIAKFPAYFVPYAGVVLGVCDGGMAILEGDTTQGGIILGATAAGPIIRLANWTLRGTRVAPAAGKFTQCFPADTVVGTEHGLRPIQDVRAADRVWAFDHAAGEWKLRHVIETYRHEHDGDVVAATVAGELVESTGHHPWWVVRGEGLSGRPQPEHVPSNPDGYDGGGRWVDAIDLRVGDVLLLRSGEEASITGLVVRHARLPVYNFHVEELHCYAVGHAQILVHNNSAEAIAKHLVADHPERFGRDLGQIQRQVEKVIASGVSIETKSGAVITRHGKHTVIRRPDGTGTMQIDENGNWARNLLNLEGGPK